MLMRKYGITYIGSKSKIIKWLSSYLPPAVKFYDVFGGGFAVSHYMVVERGGDYQKIVYNDIDSVVVETVKNAVCGKYNEDVFTPYWVSRQDFIKHKNRDGYVRFCWSFSGNTESYCYGLGVEKAQREIFACLVENKFSDFTKKILGLDKWPDTINTLEQKKNVWYSMVRSHNIQEVYYRINWYGCWKRLRHLYNDKDKILSKIEFSNCDYSYLDITDDSVVYCDPPYWRASRYNGIRFDFKRFYAWLEQQKNNAVFVSEYYLPVVGYKKIGELNVVCCCGSKTRPYKTEKLFANQKGIEMWQEWKRNNGWLLTE